MKDYSAMSDFKINEAVSMALLCDSKNPDSKYIAIGNYCSTPAAAWPIILDNKISLLWMTVENEWCATALGRLEEGCWEWSYCPDHYMNDTNPLRAAMIVFLMMKDAEHE